MQFFKNHNRISDTEQTVQMTALSDRRDSASHFVSKNARPTLSRPHAHCVAGSGRPPKKQRRHVSRFIRKDF